jgi:hypothetical protein
MLLGEQKCLKTLLNNRHCVPSLVACYLDVREVLYIVESPPEKSKQGHIEMRATFEKQS